MATSEEDSEYSTQDISSDYVGVASEQVSQFSLARFAFAYGNPRPTGIIRQRARDFKVEEELGFDLAGEGEHVFLEIQKRRLNTTDVAKKIARFAGVPHRNVGYSGRKDKHALTTQWFSVAAKENLDWEQLEDPKINVLQTKRHTRKLRKGSHKLNRFEIRVRDVQGSLDDLRSRLRKVNNLGVPNYYGEQRFGNNMSNLKSAVSLFAEHQMTTRKSHVDIVVSAARSWLFNKVLSDRVEMNNWDQPILGDLLMLSGSRSFFQCEQITDEIRQRIVDFDLSPTGPLFGTGERESAQFAREIEDRAVLNFDFLIKGLEKVGISQSRRALRVGIHDLDWMFSKSADLILTFSLPRGAYATSVLREVLRYQEPHLIVTESSLKKRKPAETEGKPRELAADELPGEIEI